MSKRRLGSDDGTVMVACAFCTSLVRYPTECRINAERNVQCYRHKDTTTNLEESRKRGRIPPEPVPPRIGIKPSWYPT